MKRWSLRHLAISRSGVIRYRPGELARTVLAYLARRRNTKFPGHPE